MIAQPENIKTLKTLTGKSSGSACNHKDTASSDNPGPAFVFISIFVRSKNVTLDIDE